MRDSDPEAAVELLGEVLELRNKAFGEEALECAEAYFYYGLCVLEQAQVRGPPERSRLGAAPQRTHHGTAQHSLALLCAPAVAGRLLCMVAPHNNPPPP